MGTGTSLPLSLIQRAYKKGIDLPRPGSSKMTRNWWTPLALALSTLELTTASAIAQDHYQLARAVHKLQDTDSLQANTTFSRSWDGAVLLKFATTQSTKPTNQTTVSSTEGIQIVCTKCYIQAGLVQAGLQIANNFNVSSGLSQTLTTVAGTVENVTDAVANDIVNYFEGLEDQIIDYYEDNGFMSTMDAIADSSLNDLPYPLPQMNLSFDVGTLAIPQVNLSVEFDNLDIYMALDTALDEKITYDVNLYTSDTPLGIGLGAQKLGITFTLDLIFSADGVVDISHGFHLKFDSLGMNISLFDNNVAQLIHNGGKFETLPVLVESAGVVLHATIRLGVHAGITMVTPSELPSITIANQSLGFNIGGGIESSIYMNVADLITNITTSSNNADCGIKASEQFQLAIGAAAGATVQAAAHTWGPAVSKQIPFFTTALADACAKHKTTVSATPTVIKRADMSTTSTRTVVTYTGVSCQSSVTGVCPASLQTTTRATETTFLSTTISSGAKVTWPKTPGVVDTVVTTMPFQNAQSFAPSSGSPVTYTAITSTSTPLATQAIDAVQAAASQLNKPLILGLSIGLGVPVLIACIAAILFILNKRKQYSAITTRVHHDYAQSSAQHFDLDPYQHHKPKQSMVQVQELRY